MIIYKMDVLAALKAAGYPTTKLRKEKLLGENLIQYLRNGKPIGIDSINKICNLLNCQPGDIIGHKKDSE